MSTRVGRETDYRRDWPEDAPAAPSPWWGVLTLILILGGLFGLGYGALKVWQYTAPKDVKLRTVVGLDRRAALDILQRDGLSPRIAQQQHSEKVPEGQVMAMRPEPGRIVKQGRAVDLLVSLGSAYTIVPDVTGVTRLKAREMVTAARLSVSREVEAYDDNAPADYVIWQKPPAKSRVPKGSKVQLRISGGPRPSYGLLEEEPTGPVEPKYADVNVEVPDDGERHQVKVVVWDDEGQRVAYERRLSGGTTLRRRVRGVGSVTIQVFVDDELVEQKTL